MLRRMEDRIKRLCQDLVAERDSTKAISLAAELRSELKRFMEDLRTRLGIYPLALVLVVFTLFPVYWVVNSSLKLKRPRSSISSRIRRTLSRS